MRSKHVVASARQPVRGGRFESIFRARRGKLAKGRYHVVGRLTARGQATLIDKWLRL
jgi:hypothetical protein